MFLIATMKYIQTNTQKPKKTWNFSSKLPKIRMSVTFDLINFKLDFHPCSFFLISSQLLFHIIRKIYPNRPRKIVNKHKCKLYKAYWRVKCDFTRLCGLSSNIIIINVQTSDIFKKVFYLRITCNILIYKILVVIKLSVWINQI